MSRPNDPARGLDTPPHGMNDLSLIASMAQVAIVDQSIHDEQPIRVTATGSTSYAGTSTAGFAVPRYSPPFVRNGVRSHSQDPFQSTPVRPTGGPATPKSTRSYRVIENWRSGSSSGSDVESPLQDKPSRIHNPNHSPTDGTVIESDMSYIGIKSEDSLDIVKAEDAQSIYPPSCCVFVANLLQSETEDTLQVAVTHVFREFGPVFVKIRRDAKQMPFAFCQYTRAEDAVRAVNEGRGRLIQGRPCRTEKAKAHRLFFIERKYGNSIDPVEAREILSIFGTIEFCRIPSDVERTALGLNIGVIVQFLLYDAGQNAQSAFRNHDLYKLTPLPGPATPARHTPPSSNRPAAPAAVYLDRYSHDRKSIFVGNLPTGTLENDLHGFFTAHGGIDDVILRENVSKFDPTGREKICFAFIEYKTVDGASEAIDKKHGANFHGRALRVTRKNSESNRNNRVAAPTAGSYQSPRHPVVSPVGPMSPPYPGYSSPYPVAPFVPYYSSPYYGYSSYGAYADPYYPSPYSPLASYPYAANAPGPGSPAPAEVTGSPSTQDAPGYYPNYQWAMYPPQYYPHGQTTEQPQLTYAYTGPAYPSPMDTSAEQDDGSATPTPTDQASVDEAPVEGDQ